MGVTDAPADRLSRLATGITGFDEISSGGFPAGSCAVVTGSVGSGKTVFALQFLAEGIRGAEEAGVFVTFGEPAAKMRRFVTELGWDVPSWEAQGRWAFVDAAPGEDDPLVVVGERYDLTVLLQRITAAVERTGAARVSIDALDVLLSHFDDAEVVRNILVRTTGTLERLGVTTVMTLGRDAADLGSHVGIEEQVADNVVALRTTPVEEGRRRTIEVVKMRGTHHRQGEFPFAIRAGQGIVVIPLTVRLDQPAMSERVASGVDGFDELTGGGLLQGSISLVSGSTGTGKTMFGLQFALAGAAAGEPTVIIDFEESRRQLLHGIAAWRSDVTALEDAGLLRFVIDYPEVRTFEEHLVEIQRAIDEIGARRLVLDSLTSLRRSGSARSFQEFAIGLTAYLKDHQITGVLTTGQESLVGPEVRATQEHISALSDAIILLRYVEVYGEIRRVLTVLKQRGSAHDTSIREFTVDERGIHVGAPLRTTVGMMSGLSTPLNATESARVDEMFRLQP